MHSMNRETTRTYTG